MNFGNCTCSKDLEKKLKKLTPNISMNMCHCRYHFTAGARKAVGKKNLNPLRCLLQLAAKARFVLLQPLCDEQLY